MPFVGADGTGVPSLQAARLHYFDKMLTLNRILHEIETKGQVVLGPGFTVEKGALFSVTQSDY